MADWKAQYLTALKSRDELEKADADVYDKFTRIADRNAELRAELRKLKVAAAKPEPSPASPVPAPLIGYGFLRQASPQPVSEGDGVAQLRHEFVKAQQERAQLQGQVESLKKDLEVANAKTKSDEAQLSRLTGNNTRLSTKLKDREEELRGKARLLENVQDENATLNLELNQAEQEVKKVKKENKDLVERWVARMGKEADKMNEESKFS